MSKLYILLFLIFLLQVANLSAQYDDHLQSLLSKMTVIETTSQEEFFKNTNLKEKGSYNIYETKDYRYNVPIGEHLKYYKNGQLLSRTLYDNFGNIIKYILYTGDGELRAESNIISLFTDANSVSEYLEDVNRTHSLTHYKVYNYDFKNCKIFLQKEGNILDTKKTGKWTFYNKDGTIKKTKTY